MSDEIVQQISIGLHSHCAAAGQQILDVVPCDDRLPDVVAGLILNRELRTPGEGDPTPLDRDAA